MFYLRHSILIFKRNNITWAQKKFIKKNYSTGTKDGDSEPLKHLPALISSSFENAQDKSKSTFLDLITIYKNRGVHRRNHVEFIYAALKSMDTFGVKNDIEVYKALINVMPKGKFIPTNIIQAEFMHYPKQQQCIIDLLEQMEDYGVIPDYEMEAILLNIFGRRGHPLRKYWRMMYWMPKFKNLSPWPLPNPVPNDALELAEMAIKRMCTVDLLSKVNIYNTDDEVDDAVDSTWIVSGISSEQSKLLLEHDIGKPLYIEGPFTIWLRNKSINYFTLRGDPNPNDLPKQSEKIDTDDIRKINIPYFGQPPVKESKLSTKIRSIHQQDDGTIYALCATGTSTKDSLLSWIRILEKNNSILGKIPILFKFRSQIDTNIVPVIKETIEKIK